MKTYWKISIISALVLAVALVILVKTQQTTSKSADEYPGPPLPRLVDLGAKSCIPCKLMAPILETMGKEYARRLRVDFIDVWENPKAGEKYGVHSIPTQILYDAAGKELERHEGFISQEDILAKFAAHGITLATATPTLVRQSPLVPSSRPAEKACFMCDGDINTATLVQVRTSETTRRFCSPHCFFIYLSSLPKPEGIEDAASVTDAKTDALVSAKTAFYRYQLSDKGRPVIEATGEKATGTLGWAALKDKEFTVRCAFCDRVTYAEDGCPVKAGGANLYACCPVCGLGVAARLQKDIVLEVKDALTGETLRIATLNGSIAGTEPSTVIAWHGQNKNAKGEMVSAGCFKQFFFANEAHLKTWLDGHPEATGKMATMGMLLADKMKLSPEQIKGACKIGDCAN
jgi:thioredoxin 1